MRTSTAYFAGVGTVVVAVAAGLGGGYLAANVVSPPTQAISKLERSTLDRKMTAESIPVSKAAAEPVPYVNANEVKSAPAAAAPEQPQAPAQAPTLPPVQTEATAPTAPAADEKNVTNVAVDRPAPSALPASKSVDSRPVEKAEKPEQKTSSSRESYAKAGDADVKRAATEKRRTERRQQSAERRSQQPREQDLDMVEERVREVTEPRRVRVRDEGEQREFAEPVRSAAPRIRLFDLDE